MADLFVSYKTEDRRRVRPLVEALQADGYSVWWDEQIDGGMVWRHAIEAELDQAKCVIVVWSKHSVGPEGTFVQDEATRAQERHVYLPVTIDKVHVPLGFGETQALPLGGWRGDRTDRRYSALLGAVRRNVGGQQLPVSPSKLPRFERRKMMIGGGVVALAIAGIGGWKFLLSKSADVSTGSIAVMPFDNLSGDPAQSYFSDGMAEELRSALTRIPDLRVVARTSSEAVRNDDVRTAAHRLGVASILTGSVRRSATTIRISAQLVDGRTGLERWSEDFDRPIGDTLTIQRDIAESVAQALRIELTGATRAALTLGGTSNPSAQDLFLKSNPAREEDSAQGIEHLIAQLDVAIQLDPEFARAYARKSAALAYYAANYTHSVSEMGLILDQAAATANQAVALTPDLSQAHSALAFTYKLQLKFKDAWRESQAAMDLPGVDAETTWRYGLYLSQIRRNGQALDAVARATTLDPLNPLAFRAQAIVLFLLHQFPLAAKAALYSLQLDNSGNYARSVLANSLLMMHRFREAGTEYSKLPPDDANAFPGRAVLAALTGDTKTSDLIVQRLRGIFGETVNYECARVYAQRRNADAAIDYLERAVTARNVGLIFIIPDPFLDPIRSDPRFNSLIQRLNFPI
jgi:serine/threonine-protein kinase